MSKGYDNYVKKIFHEVRIEPGFFDYPNRLFLTKRDQTGVIVNMVRIN